MRDAAPDPGGRIERALVRLVSVGLALTIAMQVMLASASLRPLLNVAHRAEGFRVDPTSTDIIRIPTRAVTTFADPGRMTGVVGLILRPENVSGAAVWVGDRYAGRLGGTQDPGVLYVAVRQGDEITVRRAGPGGLRVGVIETSGGVAYPPAGSEFEVVGESSTIGPVLLR